MQHHRINLFFRRSDIKSSNGEGVGPNLGPVQEPYFEQRTSKASTRFANQISNRQFEDVGFLMRQYYGARAPNEGIRVYLQHVKQVGFTTAMMYDSAILSCSRLTPQYQDLGKQLTWD